MEIKDSRWCPTFISKERRRYQVNVFVSVQLRFWLRFDHIHNSEERNNETFTIWYFDHRNTVRNALGACAPKATEDSCSGCNGETSCNRSTVATEAPVAAGPVNIAFWHAMSGHNGEVIDELVKRFNESQDKIIVTSTFQGSYDDEINKLKAGFQSKDVPAVVQVYDIGTRLMIDFGVMTPMQDFIDAENFDVADIEPNVANYYSVDGKMWSMPFNTSNPVLYYNKDMFKAAGLDPEKAPQTWAEVEAAARAIRTRSRSIYGCSFAIYGWFFEQFMAVQGAYLCG